MQRKAEQKKDFFLLPVFWHIWHLKKFSCCRSLSSDCAKVRMKKEAAIVFCDFRESKKWIVIRY